MSEGAGSARHEGRVASRRPAAPPPRRPRSALRYNDSKFYLATGREAYEAYVLYNFYTLMLQ